MAVSTNLLLQHPTNCWTVVPYCWNSILLKSCQISTFSVEFFSYKCPYNACGNNCFLNACGNIYCKNVCRNNSFDGLFCELKQSLWELLFPQICCSELIQSCLHYSLDINCYMLLEYLPEVANVSILGGGGFSQISASQIFRLIQSMTELTRA